MDIEALAEQAYKKQDYINAVKLYKKAIDEYPNRKMLFAGLAQSQYRLAKYDEALITINKGLELEGNSPELLLIKGKCLYYLKEYSKAEKSYYKALDIADEDTVKGEALINLGVIYLGKNELEEAFLSIKKGLTLYPQSWYGHHMLAIVYRRLGQAKKARREIRTSFRLNPSRDSLIFLLSLHLLLLLKASFLVGLVYLYGFTLYSGNITSLSVLIVFFIGGGMLFISNGKKRAAIQNILMALVIFLIYAVFWIIGK